MFMEVQFWFINSAGTLECLWKSKMAAVMHLVFNLWIVINRFRSHVLSEIDLFLAFFFDKLHLKYRYLREIQDGHHQPFCF